MKRIIVATDGSSGANRALDMGARMAKDSGSKLIILTIGGNIKSNELRHLASIAGDLSKTLKSASNKILTQAKKRVERMGLADVKLQCEWGDPAEAIINTVKREKADILVIGRRGQGRLAGLLLGSISQKLVALAPCTVVVVP